MQNREREVWCPSERQTAITILRQYPMPLQEHRWDTRSVMIGNLLHGGDLEADAILCNASGGSAIYQGALELRHGQHFTDYFVAAFPAFYFTLTKKAALWLECCGHGGRQSVATSWSSKMPSSSSTSLLATSERISKGIINPLPKIPCHPGRSTTERLSCYQPFRQWSITRLTGTPSTTHIRSSPAIHPPVLLI
jgi:hypothetical protein